MTTIAPDENLNTQQAAQFLGVKEGTLETWRCTKRYDLPFVKVGRLVRYKKSALIRWLDSRTQGGDHAK